MRKLGLLVSLIIGLGLISNAQDCNYLSFKAKLESVSSDSARMLVMTAYLNCVTDSLERVSQNSQENIEVYEQERRSLKEINIEKLQYLEDNLINAPDLLEAINEDIYIIKNELIQKDLGNYIKDIYNPQSNVTGKKFEDIITEQIEAQVISKLAQDNRKFGEKQNQIMNAVKEIASTPLLNAIPGVGGAITVTNSVVNFVRTVTYNEAPTKSLELIKAFEDTISSYLGFYSELQQANSAYSYSLSEINARIGSLEKDYHEYLMNSMASFEDSLDLSSPNYQQDTSRKLQHDVVQFEIKHYLRDRVKQFDTADAFNTLKNNISLLEFNNGLDRLQLFIVELEKIFDIYKSVNRQYQDQIVDIVEEHGTFIQPDFKDKITKELAEKMDKAEASVTGLVSMEDIQRKVGVIRFSEIHL